MQDLPGFKSLEGLTRNILHLMAVSRNLLTKSSGICYMHTPG